MGPDGAGEFLVDYEHIYKSTYECLTAERTTSFYTFVAPTKKPADEKAGQISEVLQERYAPDR
jgi:hypothetical protein